MFSSLPLFFVAVLVAEVVVVIRIRHEPNVLNPPLILVLRFGLVDGVQTRERDLVQRLLWRFLGDCGHQ